MDTARTFSPHTIFVWRKLQQHAETERIVEMFPKARVEIVDRQRPSRPTGRSRVHPLVAGKRTLLIGEASSFVRRFDGRLGDGVRCWPYMKLVPMSNGCPYYCTYCYLACVYRDHLPLIKMNVNYGKMFEEIREAPVDCWNPVAFNMGEMLDSLALDHVTMLVERLVPFFSHLPNACLMLLTKSRNVGGLLRCKPHPQVVASWSLNTQRMIEAYEIGTPQLDERIEAARRCQEHGYRIRLRIDPGILYEQWRTDYADLVRKAMAVLEPENVTLGMLRLVPGHASLAKQAYGSRGAELQTTGLCEKASDGKLRYPARRRIEFYRSLIDVIRSFSPFPSISLCRETPDVWNELNHLCDPDCCNCLP